MTTREHELTQLTDTEKDQYLSFTSLLSRGVWQLLRRISVYDETQDHTHTLRMTKNAEELFNHVESTNLLQSIALNYLLEAIRAINCLIDEGFREQAEKELVLLYRNLVNLLLGSLSSTDTEILSYIKAMKIPGDDVQLDTNQIVKILLTPQVETSIERSKKQVVREII